MTFRVTRILRDMGQNAKDDDGKRRTSFIPRDAAILWVTSSFNDAAFIQGECTCLLQAVASAGSYCAEQFEAPWSLPMHMRALPASTHHCLVRHYDHIIPAAPE
jgi:hypothetical protein